MQYYFHLGLDIRMRYLYQDGRNRVSSIGGYLLSVFLRLIVVYLYNRRLENWIYWLRGSGEGVCVSCWICGSVGVCMVAEKEMERERQTTPTTSDVCQHITKPPEHHHRWYYFQLSS